MPPLTDERLEIRYVPLDTVVLWDKNAKRHDIAGISDSIRRHGFRDAPIFDASLGALVAGNGRTGILRQMQVNGEPPPRGVIVDKKGRWLVPVQFGIDADSASAAAAFAVDHNNLTATGGDLGLFEVAKMWDDDGYRAILADLEAAAALPVTVSGDDYKLLFEAAQFPGSTVGDDQNGGDQDTSNLLIKVKCKRNDQYEEAATIIREAMESAGIECDVVA
jgi:hypothetical protein